MIHTDIENGCGPAATAHAAIMCLSGANQRHALSQHGLVHLIAIHLPDMGMLDQSGEVLCIDFHGQIG